MERKLSISAANSNPLAIGCFLQYFIFYLIWLWRLWTPVTDSHFSSTQKWLISVPRKYQGNTSNGDLAELVRSLAVLFLLSGKVLVVSSEVSWWRSGENHAVFTYEEKWWSSSLSPTLPISYFPHVVGRIKYLRFASQHCYDVPGNVCVPLSGLAE